MINNIPRVLVCQSVVSPSIPPLTKMHPHTHTHPPTGVIEKTRGRSPPLENLRIIEFKTVISDHENRMTYWKKSPLSWLHLYFRKQIMIKEITDFLCFLSLSCSKSFYVITDSCATWTFLCSHYARWVILLKYLLTNTRYKSFMGKYVHSENYHV